MLRNTFLRRPGYNIVLLLLLLLIDCFSATAKGGGTAPQPSIFENSLVLILLIIMLILLLVIALLANLVRGGMDVYRDKRNSQPGTSNKTTGLMTIIVLIISIPVFAGAPEIPVASQGAT